jgi:hypothetical protein
MACCRCAAAQRRTTPSACARPAPCCGPRSRPSRTSTSRASRPSTTSPVALIATASAWADYARQLGAAADACALADPLLPPPRVLETLEGVPLPAVRRTAAALPRCPHPAAASGRLGVAQGGVVQPAGDLPARHGPVAGAAPVPGALVGAPQAATARHSGPRARTLPRSLGLPGRPELDRLLEEAGAPLSWDPSAAGGAGAYRLATWAAGRRPAPPRVLTPATDLSAGPDGDAEVADAAAVEERLKRGLQQGGLLVLTVHPRIARRAEAELLHRFGAPALSLRRCSA